MNQWSLEQFDENKYFFTYTGVRNVILCSLDRFEEFDRLAQELECLHYYKIIAAPFCPSSTIYLADNEGTVTQYKVDNE